MSYTTTFDASHKVKRGGHATQFARHIGRDEDAACGFRFGHSNKGIDPARTHLNLTMVNDGAGGYRRPVVTVGETGERPPSAELEGYLDSRLATVTKTLRKDAVVMRPFVFKADPAWYDEHCPDWRESGLNDAALALHDEAVRFVENWGGQHNVVGYADHLDEAGHPERQIIFTPVTDDGRLSQKDFFPNPTALKKMHRELREHLRDTCGYDAALTVSKRSREHLSSDAYAARADKLKVDQSRLNGERRDLAEGLEQLDAERADDDRDRRDFDTRKAVLSKQWGDYNAACRDLDARSAAVDERERSVSRAETDVEQREAAVADRSKSLDERDLALGSRELAVNVARVENDERTRALDDRERVVSRRESEVALTQAAIRAEQDRLRHEAEELDTERAATTEARQRYDQAAEAMKKVSPRDMTVYMHRYMRAAKVNGSPLLEIVKRGAVKEFNKAHPFEDPSGPKAKRTVGQAEDTMAAGFDAARSMRAQRQRDRQGQSRGVSR